MTYCRQFRQEIFAAKWAAVHWVKISLILLFSIMHTATNLVFAGNNKPLVSTYSENISVPVYSVETRKKFDDVMEDLFIVIAENNFRLTQHAQIGKAIAERNNISFPSATVIHFCNLNYAKELLQLVPDYLLRMPCRISVWPNANGSSIIKVWLLPEDDERTLEFAKKINTILKNIVTYSAN